MGDTTDQELVKTWIRNLDTSELMELWETLTNEINTPSVILNMNFFLEEYLPECISAKSMTVIDLARIVTGNDGLVKHFDVNDEFVYVNDSSLWESVNERDIVDLVLELIDGYDLVKYSTTIKDKLAELKEDFDQE